MAEDPWQRFSVLRLTKNITIFVLQLPSNKMQARVYH